MRITRYKRVSWRNLHLKLHYEGGEITHSVVEMMDAITLKVLKDRRYY